MYRREPGRPSFGYVFEPLTFSGIDGVWAEQLIDNTSWFLNTDTTFEHKMGLDTRDPAQPNVRWLLFGFQHDNTGAGAGSTVAVGYAGGLVTPDSIQLRVFASGRTINVAHPLRIALWICPAKQGIAP